MEEEKYKRLQIQIVNDINETENILSITSGLIPYLNMGPHFADDLELTSSTLQELIRRTSSPIDPQYIKQFVLSTKQIKLMAMDLLKACKKNMYAA